MSTSLSKSWTSMTPNPVGILNQLVRYIYIFFCMIWVSQNKLNNQNTWLDGSVSILG